MTKEQKEQMGKAWEKINHELKDKGGVNPYAYELGWADCLTTTPPPQTDVVEKQQSIPDYLEKGLEDFFKAAMEFDDGYRNVDGKITRVNIAALSTAYKQAQTELKKCFNRYKANEPGKITHGDAVPFADWLKTFEPLTKENGQWVLECQISSQELYAGFLKRPLISIKNLSDADALECANVLVGMQHLSDHSKISQIKDLLCTNKLYNMQTNIAGHSWYELFKMLEQKGYVIN